MLNWIITFSLRHRLLVAVSVLALAAVGAISLRYLDIDAFPDTTPVQVQINTTAPALGPEEVERRLTFPIEQSLGGLPGLVQLRSVSKFGLSQVVVTFRDGTDIYFARQLVTERLNAAALPEGVERPSLGPVATGLGEVFHYVVTAPGYDFSTLPEAERIKKLIELRTLHDWIIRPQLRTVKGVAEVTSWGGYEKQYQVRIDPERLIKYGLTFDEVFRKVRDESNYNAGGGSIRQKTQMFLVHGVGRAGSAEDLRAVVLGAREGVPVRLGDVADVEVGYEIRRGAVTADGKGEVVLGLGFMLMGENSHEVATALKKRLEEVQASLPPGVRVQVVYDRTELVNHVIDTVRGNLFEGGLLVVAVLFFFLGNLRAAFLVALAIPLSMLFAFSGMLRFGIAASLLSLGAIDFGMVVDSSVVLIENVVRHIGGRDSRVDRLEVVRAAALEVRKPTLFGELIIMLVYLPILTLEGIEGKLFRPMALTVIFALLGSMVLSLTLMPILASVFLFGDRRQRSLAGALFDGIAAVLVRVTVAGAVWYWTGSWLLGAALLALLLALWLSRGQPEREPLLMRVAHAIHTPILRLCMDHKFLVVGLAVGALVVAFGTIAPHLGSEFVPRLSEGAITVNVVRLAGTDLEESLRLNTRMEKALLAAFPDEVDRVWSRVGTAEVATDPMGVELTDLFVTLKTRNRWRRAATQAELTTLIEKTLREMPGQRLAYSQPIELRMNEMVSGVRADLAVKVFGDDLETLKAKAAEVEKILKGIDGGADVSAEQVTGQPVLQVKVDPDGLARHGLTARAVLDLVESVGSKPLGEVVEGQMRFPLAVRLPERWRTGPEAIGAMLIATPAGERIPLARVAKVQVLEGPSTLTREWGQRRVVVTANVRGRDLGSFVAEAQERIATKVQMPPGRYHLEWGGQFEHYERARLRLLIVVPLAALLVFALLYVTYRNVVDALRVFTGVPFGWVGGIVALWLRDMPFSISAAIGFIALSGVAVLDDMILVSYVRQLRRRGLSVDEAVRRAAVTRLRPVLMTTLVASLGFLPMAFSTGMGAEVQRPLATVVIGGVIGAMLMSLLVLRVLYLAFDSLASAAVGVLTGVFGYRAEQLAWLAGDYRAEAEKRAGGGSRQVVAAVPAGLPDET
ncbi:MAG: efflux RND transporter permease subunit [Gemmataceae bacterium]|nr:efflux RND transporter permease subunit [Gemmataceae bacterium]